VSQNDRLLEIMRAILTLYTIGMEINVICVTGKKFETYTFRAYFTDIALKMLNKNHSTALDTTN